MKATIDIDDALYRRLKIEAARRGRTVRDLVAEGVRSVLDAPAGDAQHSTSLNPAEWQPGWFGTLARYAKPVNDHSMSAVRENIARGREPKR